LIAESNTESNNELRVELSFGTARFERRRGGPGIDPSKFQFRPAASKIG
jgi:hypothetical protein